MKPIYHFENEELDRIVQAGMIANGTHPIEVTNLFASSSPARLTQIRSGAAVVIHGLIKTGWTLVPPLKPIDRSNPQ